LPASGARSAIGDPRAYVQRLPFKPIETADVGFVNGSIWIRKVGVSWRG
jgi:hypothetical protein